MRDFKQMGRMDVALALEVIHFFRYAGFNATRTSTYLLLEKMVYKYRTYEEDLFPTSIHVCVYPAANLS